MKSNNYKSNVFCVHLFIKLIICFSFINIFTSQKLKSFILNENTLIIPYRGIGDLIFHVPLIRGLYKKYNSKINILTNEVNRAKNLLGNEKPK